MVDFLIAFVCATIVIGIFSFLIGKFRIFLSIRPLATKRKFAIYANAAIYGCIFIIVIGILGLIFGLFGVFSYYFFTIK